jgi:CheY-like chemotaxis protein
MAGGLSKMPVILLVEDDPGDVLMITEALEHTGSPRDIRLACDGQEALDFLHRTGAHAHAPRPDLILLDLNMPRLDGRQALKAIKADKDLRIIPVVVFTTSAAETDIISSYQLHANAYVTKPLDLDTLDVVVRHIDRFFTAVSTLPPSDRQAS